MGKADKEKPRIWVSLDPGRYVGIETKFCFRTVNTFWPPRGQTVFVHKHKATFKWLATSFHISLITFSQTLQSAVSKDYSCSC